MTLFNFYFIFLALVLSVCFLVNRFAPCGGALELKRSALNAL